MTRQLYMAILGSVTLIFTFLSIINFGGFDSLNNYLIDMNFKLRGSRDTSNKILMVVVDDRSVRDVGPWRWNRSKIAELIRIISSGNPKVVGIDIVFPHDPSQAESGDNEELLKVFQSMDNLVLPFYFFNEEDPEQTDVPRFLEHSAYALFIPNMDELKYYPPPKGKSVSTSIEAFSNAASRLGYFNAFKDADGVLRQTATIIEYKDHYFPSFQIAIYSQFADLNRGNITVRVGEGISLGGVNIPTDSHGLLYINYAGGNKSYLSVSAADVLNGKCPVKNFEDRIVLVGVNAAGTTHQTDRVVTPFEAEFPGIEVNANIVGNLLESNFLIHNNSTKTLDIIFIIITGLFLTLILPRLGFIPRVIIPVLFFTVSLALPYIFFIKFNTISGLAPLIVMNFIMVVLGISIKPKEEIAAMIAEEVEKTVIIEKEKLALGKPSDGKTRFGRYEVESVLGKGAMGTVYKAKDPVISRIIALKTIRLDFAPTEEEHEHLKKRLHQEAQAAGNLNHPNIITIYDVGEQEGLAYIAMEFLEGKTLETLIKKQVVFTPKITADLIHQVSLALDFAHEANIVHRDIKPANIMIQKGRLVKVMDYGIAHLQSSTLTQEGTALGTPSYLAPEALTGVPIDGRADIFSLGVVLYEMLTLEKPFTGESIPVLIRNILNEEPLPPSSLNPVISEEFDAIVLRALKKNRDERYQKATDFSTDLIKAVKG